MIDEQNVVGMNHGYDLGMIDRRWDTQQEWVVVEIMVRMNHEYDLKLMDRKWDTRQEWSCGRKRGANELPIRLWNDGLYMRHATGIKLWSKTWCEWIMHTTLEWRVVNETLTLASEIRRLSLLKTKICLPDWYFVIRLALPILGKDIVRSLIVLHKKKCKILVSYKR